MAAPRFAAPRDSLAAANDARKAAEDAAADTLSDHVFDDCYPFGEAEDLAAGALRMAHSLTIVIGNLLRDAGDDRSSVRNCHLAGAVDAIGHLIATSDFANNVAARAGLRQQDASK